MKTSASNTSSTKDIIETISAVAAQTRSKIISAADVWNIQRHKRSFVQRRVSI